MILRYSWGKIRRVSGSDPRRVIMAVKSMLELPRNQFDPLYFYYRKDFTGQSYLVNIEEVLANDYFYKPKEIADYIALASFRNYSQYTTIGDTSLDLLHSPLGQDTINKNRLLSIENDKIKFKYEEVTQGE